MSPTFNAGPPQCHHVYGSEGATWSKVRCSPWKWVSCHHSWSVVHVTLGRDEDVDASSKMST